MGEFIIEGIVKKVLFKEYLRKKNIKESINSNELTKEEALENLKEIFKSNTFLYDERELPNLDINRFNNTAINLYKVANAILTEQELNKILGKLSISDVNSLPLNKAIELSIGLKGVLLSRENISDRVGVIRGFSDKSNYDYLINDVPFSNKFRIVTEDSLKRDQGISEFISKFVSKLKDNNVGSISNVAYEGHIIQVDYGIEKSNTETNGQPLSDLLNQVNEALVQFGNPKLNTQQYKVSIEPYNKGNKEVSYHIVYKDTYAEGSNDIVDTFNLTLPEDLESILFNYTIQVKSNKKLHIIPNGNFNVDFNIAKKYGLPTKSNQGVDGSDSEMIKLDLNQPTTTNKPNIEQKPTTTNKPNIEQKPTISDKSNVNVGKVEVKTNGQPLSDLLNQVNDALVQFGNPRLVTDKENIVFIRNLKSGVMNVNYYGTDKYDSFELNLPKDLNDLLLEYNVNIVGRNISFQLRNSKNIDAEVAKKYGLPTETGDKLRLNLQQPETVKESHRLTEDELINIIKRIILK